MVGSGAGAPLPHCRSWAVGLVLVETLQPTTRPIHRHAHALFLSLLRTRRSGTRVCTKPTPLWVPVPLTRGLWGMALLTRGMCSPSRLQDLKKL
jgi:hypothetical protein